MHTLKMLTFATLAAWTASAASAPTPAMQDFGWFTGHWCTTDNGDLVEEHWMKPAGDLMLGLSRTVKSGKTKSFEFLRIEFGAGAVRYVAQPGG